LGKTNQIPRKFDIANKARAVYFSSIKVMKTNVLIIGLGQIGCGYDLNLSPDTHVFSHARAFTLHPDFNLVGGVDPDANRRELFNSYYELPTFSSVEDALKNLHPDVLVVANPTSEHFSTIQQILKFSKPKMILCEKPLAFDEEEAKQIVQLCESSSCELFVNYMRRADVGCNEVMNKITSGNIVTPVTGFAWYTKGLFNGASHFINLLEYWLGEVREVVVLNKGRVWKNNDPEPDFELKFEKGVVKFAALKEENFFHNSIELMSSNGCLRYEKSGALITWKGAEASPTLTDYRMLSDKTETLATDFTKIQWHVADELSKFIKNKKTNLCNGQAALITVNICSEIRRSL
jgi:predicted dehydrogenase